MYENHDVMRRLYTILLILLFALSMQAQSLVVQSFRMDEQDLTANTAGTTIFDQNGHKCALIKVETTQTGFSFDAGSLGVTKTEQHVGEIWIYVPEGVKRLTISHQQFGVLRDYDLGQMTKRAHTYIMKLTTGEVQTIVKQSRTSQYVVFQLQPANAVVELDGNMLTTQDGVASRMMPFGTYSYRVQAPDYLPEVGKVTVNDPKQKHFLDIKLKPNFSQVTITVDNNAEIWVNGQKRGEGSWTGNLGAGTYELETRKAGHRPQTTTRDIAVTTEPQTIRLQAPIPIYGEADIASSPMMADIYIDNVKRGQTPQLIDQLLIGQHQVRLTRQGYADYTSTLTVKEGETASVNATLTNEVAQAPTTPSSSSTESSGDSQRTITVGNVSFTMIRVEGGTFQMGATKEMENPNDDEKPVHQVTLSSYYIGETEVTQALWKAVMGTTIRQQRDKADKSFPIRGEGADYPMYYISWDDCQEFISRLNQKTGLQFRLPTEAEWEYAARGGNKSRGYQYSGSNNLGDVAWHKSNNTYTVYYRWSNELGIQGMSGNVREWCQDWYGSYSSSTQNNPTGPNSGSLRVIRGGDWDCEARDCRSSNRRGKAARIRASIYGLRLAL